MFDSTVLTFRAKADTVGQLEELTKQTGLSRSRLIALLIERAQVKPVIRYDIDEASLSVTKNGGARGSEAERTAVPHCLPIPSRP